jgi:hypothetical protein
MHEQMVARLVDAFEKRFWSKVTKSGGCWDWGKTINTNGYGVFYVARFRPVAAHRLAYEMAHGPVPDGLCVCHTCDNRKCVNPAHLFLGTNADNVADRESKGRGRPSNPKGSASWAATLDEKKVLAIRKQLSAGGKQTEVAKAFGISQSTISQIKRRKTWTHI